jgi:hypothetical protein
MQPAANVKVNYILLNDEVFETEIVVYAYTEKSIAFTCSEHFGKAFSEYLKDIASYNPKLKIGKGWVLSNPKYPKLQELIAKISDKQIKGAIPTLYNRRKSVELVAPIVEPSIITNFKNLIENLNEEKENKTIYVNQDKTYIWGKKDEVLATVVGMDKNILQEFNFGDKCIVITN